MANQEAIDRYIASLVDEVNDVDRADRERATHRVRFLISSGILGFLAVSTAASVVIYVAANPSDVAPAHAFVGFLLLLLGVWLVLLSLVADHQFPRAARVGAAIAMARRQYLFDPHMPAGLLQPAVTLADRGCAARRVRLLIVNSGVLLISTAGSVVIYTAANPSDVDDSKYALVAFVLLLLGVWLLLLALVVDQFSRAARLDVAIARALQD